MATYIYQCQRCQFTFEFSQSFSEDPLLICPECGESALDKLPTLPYIIVKQGYSSVRDIRQISEKNFKDLGKEKYQKMVEQYGKKEPTKKWFNQYTTLPDQKVAKLTPQQQHKYIVEGKL